MGNPTRIALFSFMAGAEVRESKLRILALAGVVSAIIIFGSISLVRFSNRDRQLTPAIVAAAQSLSALPDTVVSTQYALESFTRRRDDFANQIASGALPVDSVRAFYQAYSRWMRDGRWDSNDVTALGEFLGLPAQETP